MRWGSSGKESLASLFAVLVVASENRAIDVRPEFFEDVEKAVEADLGEPFLSGLGPGAFGSRVIKIGDPRSCPVSDNFGEIEGAASRIGSGNQKTAYRIARALKKPAMSERVVSRILMGHGRDDGFRHIVSDRLIGEGVPIVAAIPRGPLTKLGSRIFCLGGTGERSRDNKRGIIKAVLRGEPKLILYR